MRTEDARAVSAPVTRRSEMIKRFDDNANRILDEIIEVRRTIRAFAAEAPRPDMRSGVRWL